MATAGRTVTRAELEQYEQSEVAVFVPDAFGHLGGAWVHKLSTALWNKIRSAAKLGTDDNATLAVEKFEALQFCEAVRTGPESDSERLFQPTEWSVVAELVPPGIRSGWCCLDALQGYDNAERAKLPNYLGGEIFASGASTASAASPAISTSRTRKSTERTATTDS